MSSMVSIPPYKHSVCCAFLFISLSKTVTLGVLSFGFESFLFP